MTYDGNEPKDTKTNSPLAPKQDNSWVKSLPEYQQPSFKSRSLKQNRADRPEPAAAPVPAEQRAPSCEHGYYFDDPINRPPPCGCRPVVCFVCQAQMYYDGDKRHEPEFTLTSSTDRTEGYVHKRCIPARTRSDIVSGLVEALKAITMVAGNLSDEAVEGVGGINDARSRALMVVHARAIARTAIAQAREEGVK